MADTGLDLPAELLPAAVHVNPIRWRLGRFEWARRHDWGPHMLGFLAFFDETVYLYQTAMGMPPPMGSAQRYERRLADAL